MVLRRGCQRMGFALGGADGASANSTTRFERPAATARRLAEASSSRNARPVPAGGARARPGGRGCPNYLVRARRAPRLAAAAPTVRPLADAASRLGRQRAGERPRRGGWAMVHPTKPGHPDNEDFVTDFRGAPGPGFYPGAGGYFHDYDGPPRQRVRRDSRAVARGAETELGGAPRGEARRSLRVQHLVGGVARSLRSRWKVGRSADAGGSALSARAGGVRAARPGDVPPLVEAVLA